MAQEIQRYFSTIQNAIRQRNGVAFATHLHIPYPNDPAQTMIGNFAPRLKDLDVATLCSSQIFDANAAPTFAFVFMATVSMIDRDYESAYRNVGSAYSALMDYFALKDENMNWLIPAISLLSKTLRRTAALADASSHDTKFLRDSINQLQKGFTVVVRDRTPITQPQSKKLAIFVVTNALFKIYFQLNSLQLCTKLISTVEGPGAVMENLHLFSLDEVVTYKYYVGRLRMFEDRYDEAREYLRFALRYTPLNLVRNRQRILATLVPIEMIYGVMPSLLLAQRYGLHEYYELGQATQRGDLAGYTHLMDECRVTFIHHGVYLVLEQTRSIAYRNLFRRVYMIQDTSRLNLVSFQVALESLGEIISVEEVECIVANLIYQNRIKGYISHEKKFLIVSKSDPFPISAVITKPT